MAQAAIKDRDDRTYLLNNVWSFVYPWSGLNDARAKVETTSKDYFDCLKSPEGLKLPPDSKP